MPISNHPHKGGEPPKQLGNRAFGLIFAAIFIVVAAWPVLFGKGLHAYREWAVIVAALFAVPALVYPACLQPLNNLWTKFGLLMHSIINPLLMGLIFFIAVLPTGMIIKLLGKDPMRRRIDAQAETYWLARTDSEFSEERFRNQF